MSRHFTTLIAAVAMLGFVGAASVHAQATKQNPTPAEENRNTNPQGKDKMSKDKAAPKTQKMVAPKGKNAPQADDNRNTDPTGQKKN